MITRLHHALKILAAVTVTLALIASVGLAVAFHHQFTELQDQQQVTCTTAVLSRAALASDVAFFHRLAVRHPHDPIVANALAEHRAALLSPLPSCSR